ncbi:peptidoglycan-binding protein [Tumebacillus sp. ITR2]|uniref:Peptidoglycan-binding protein n=1 Tax=Tumebacillus amylolyticus TaxID=2801339 RepID=A0ABS1JA97_9BACL|nr:peptidoglycan-binding protein [Tumebacillus amylolyticus]MBL0387188.1 peptidoglycan-binding protein [Tumebacillus amylolyticus]
MIYASRFLRLVSPYLRGPDVASLQERMLELGLASDPPDGVFGPGTAAAVRRFQELQGLQQDGVVGPETWTALGASEAVSLLVAASGEHRLHVDTERCVLYVYKSGHLVKTFSVGVGSTLTSTPLGDWKITQKAINPGGPFGTRWMRLNIPFGGYGIHGTDNPHSIGKGVSHGCIRMQNKDVEELYDLIPLGTLVKVSGKAFTSRILRLGVSYGTDVIDVQRILQTLGYYKGDLDGVYGPVTAAAVRSFQADKDLVVDGIIGSSTVEALVSNMDEAMGGRNP